MPLARTLAAVATFFLLLATAHARVDPPHPALDPHHVDASNLGDPIDLTSALLVHAGDDPAWASPALDDSQWHVCQTAQPRSRCGIDSPGMLWFRTHVSIPPHAHDLALELRTFGGSYQVFVNGVQIGGSGSMSQEGDLLYTFDRRLPIPDALLASGNLTIAFRLNAGFVARTAPPVAFVSASSITLGSAPALLESAHLFVFRQFTSNAARLVVDGIVLLIALALALVLRSEREYVAIAVAFATIAFANAAFVWVNLHNLPITLPVALLQNYASVISTLAIIEFVRGALSLPRSRLILFYEWALAIASFVVGTIVITLNHRVGGIPSTAVLINVVLVQILYIPSDLGLPLVALWVWFKRRNSDALLLFPSLLLQAIYSYWSIALFILGELHVISSTTVPYPPIPGFYVAWNEITEFFFSISILLFLVLRTVRIARTRAGLAAEVAAAQSVQQLLLARSSLPTPGFRVETAYQPASQVGGDFFLVSPNPADGSLIAIVGDVSGKGLTAAMRVAMILGVLQRETSRSPDVILANLNHALLNQSDMGFTTACCLHVKPSGAYTIANAGHISPYLAGHNPSGIETDGVELPAPPALPLGLAPGQIYETLTGLLSPTQTLVLLSDGIPEARQPRGALLGFDALPSLTRLPAAEIALTAHNFGQEDDITVLSIALA